MSSNYEYFAGVDPGKEGAITIIDSTSQVIDCRKLGEGFTTLVEMFEDMISEIDAKRLFCVCEQVGGRFGDGASRAFNFGYSTASTHNALVIAKIPFDLKIPRTWQKYFGMTRNKKGGETYEQYKRRLKEKAITLFPHHKVTLWNADALLIAEYCKRNY